MIPPSTKEGIDDAVFGVAVWEGVDPRADRFSIYVRGISDGHRLSRRPMAASPSSATRPCGSTSSAWAIERNLNEKEIQLNDPPYEWVYWRD